jgi:hypothetical protein
MGVSADLEDDFKFVAAYRGMDEAIASERTIGAAQLKLGQRAADVSDQQTHQRYYVQSRDRLQGTQTGIR